MKTPIAFVVFMLMALFIKTREWRYCRNGNTHADYEAFLKTNRNSLHFSLFMAALLLVAGFIDYFLLSYVTDAAKVMSRMPFWVAAEIGDSIMLIFVAPLLLLLLSYTRRPRLQDNDLAIPVAAIALMGLVVLQGPVPDTGRSEDSPIDFQEIKAQVGMFASLLKM